MFAPLKDTFGRIHDNLRVSVTDRCNIRCQYCMPEDNPVYVAQREILTFEEIERVVRVASRLGITKVRLTGGEPLVRSNLPVLVEKLVGLPGIADVALTTNGVLLEEHAQPLRAAGLRRLNVHLDTLDEKRFFQITRRNCLDRVLAGLEAASSVGFERIKINAVAHRGLTEPDIVPLVELARERGFEVRFIELMPLDADGQWRRDQVLFRAEILETLARVFGPWEPVPGRDPRAPAEELRFPRSGITVGVIASVSQPFCGSCNRVRLTADGKLRNCLFALDELDLKKILRGGGSDEEVADVFRASVQAKWEGHEIHAAKFVQPPRPMHSIGG